MLRLANSLLLSSVDWDVFATLTYRSERATISGAVADGLLWLELVRCRCRLSEEDHYWYLRPERGESEGRIHLHALLRVPPKFRTSFLVPAGMLSQAHKLWGRGLTRFRQVEGKMDPAVIYLQKGDTCLSDNYEVQKTSADSNGFPSNALLTRALLQKPAGGGCAGHSVCLGKPLVAIPG